MTEYLYLAGVTACDLFDPLQTALELDLDHPAPLGRATIVVAAVTHYNNPGEVDDLDAEYFADTDPAEWDTTESHLFDFEVVDEFDVTLWGPAGVANPLTVAGAELRALGYRRAALDGSSAGYVATLDAGDLLALTRDHDDDEDDDA
jgi:hypothetical protein